MVANEVLVVIGLAIVLTLIVGLMLLSRHMENFVTSAVTQASQRSDEFRRVHRMMKDVYQLACDPTLPLEIRLGILTCRLSFWQALSHMVSEALKAVAAKEASTLAAASPDSEQDGDALRALAAELEAYMDELLAEIKTTQNEVTELQRSTKP